VEENPEVKIQTKIAVVVKIAVASNHVKVNPAVENPAAKIKTKTVAANKASNAATKTARQGQIRNQGRKTVVANRESQKSPANQKNPGNLVKVATDHKTLEVRVVTTATEIVPHVNRTTNLRTNNK
jgi:hypothetical protein